jgi:D-alanyl-D-alanine carboxypeptidase/D-alanyl-D-alanine-endopeptidase (penicillin-binding protein 4)
MKILCPYQNKKVFDPQLDSQTTQKEGIHSIIGRLPTPFTLQTMVMRHPIKPWILSVMAFALISLPMTSVFNGNWTSLCFATDAMANPAARENPAVRSFAYSPCPSESWQTTTAVTPRLEIDLQRLIGKNDAVLLADPSGRVLVSMNSNSMLIPASTFKLLTSLSAIYHLGRDFRFITEFYKDPSDNLVIKGFGDPLLISETLPQIAGTLAGKIQHFHDLVLDDFYYQSPLFIPGRSLSTQPYDALNGALCVNFNTVAFRKAHGTFVSAEDQTPLLPFTLNKIRASGLKEGRITFSNTLDDNLAYCAELFSYHFNQFGIRSNGRFRRGKTDPSQDILLLRHVSPFSLDQVVAKLLEYSNNFMANQLFLTTGAMVLGPPATLEKAIAVTRRYADEVLGIKQVTLVEGSGLSRQNRLSAAQMLKIVEAFAPYHRLMRHEGRQYYKTGTLKDIRTRVGYIESPSDCLFSFVVFVNTPGKDTDKIMQALEKAVNADRQG